MILSYSIISSIILGFCFIAYRIFMAGQRQHSVNRNSLLLIYAISLLLPFAVLAFITHHPELSKDVSTIEIGDITSEVAGDADAGFFAHINIFALLINIYLIGLIVTGCYYLFGISMLVRIFKKGELTEFDNFNLILVSHPHKTAPFSWGNNIVMNKSDYEEDGDMILIHEYAHLKLHHWTDLVLAYITICLQWYNPAAWAMREELKAIHEYQADESVVDSGIDAKEYQMLLLKRAVGSRFQSFANSLNHSKLQKRVTMMYKKKTSWQRKLFALALVPAICAGLAVTAIPSVAGVLESLASVSTAISPNSIEKSESSDKREVFVQVENQPDFPGGMEALMRYLSNNVRYPEEAHKANEQGRVIIKFIVNKDGSVSDPEIVRGVSKSLDAEAIRVVSSLPKWIPGTVNGNPVDCYFTLPINFRLQTETPQEAQ